MRSLSAVAAILLLPTFVTGITVNSTSGQLRGVVQDGVMSFKGIRYARSPTGNLRWETPVPFTSSEEQDATTLGPSCVQQITSNLSRELFNTPPPPESEDCLFLYILSRNCLYELSEQLTVYQERVGAIRFRFDSKAGSILDLWREPCIRNGLVTSL
uniref:Carboxylesterase type B domain-containing protein n=1 Tax=Moniliophthora roreri TaxID=221103 RepID=A0A0W0GBW9_MONRR